MEFLCTICSRNKHANPGPLPAIERYQSKRITFVHQESLRLGKPMVILSGKYGLLRLEYPIPWYDQKLVMEAVPTLVPTIARQLEREGIMKIIFYCRPKTDKEWSPYHTALEQACKLPSVELSYRFLEPM